MPLNGVLSVVAYAPITPCWTFSILALLLPKLKSLERRVVLMQIAANCIHILLITSKRVLPTLLCPCKLKHCHCSLLTQYIISNRFTTLLVIPQYHPSLIFATSYLQWSAYTQIQASVVKLYNTVFLKDFRAASFYPLPVYPYCGTADWAINFNQLDWKTRPLPT